MTGNARPVALVTGAARRIGAAIARELHRAGFDIAVHCRRSRTAATALTAELNGARPASAAVLHADLAHPAGAAAAAGEALARWRRMDLVVNNASSFYPTPIGSIEPAHWEDLLGSNVGGALFLSQALANPLRERRGSIVNISDIHARGALPRHTAYCIAKAGLDALTRSLATELAPAVRVNGVAPGAIYWPPSLLPPQEGQPPDSDGAGRSQRGPDAPVGGGHFHLSGQDATERSQRGREALLRGIPSGRLGSPRDIAGAVRFLAVDASYMTGQVIAVDGGRRLLPQLGY